MGSGSTWPLVNLMWPGMAAAAAAAAGHSERRSRGEPAHA